MAKIELETHTPERRAAEILHMAWLEHQILGGTTRQFLWSVINWLWINDIDDNELLKALEKHASPWREDQARDDDAEG